ncbi:hypothetical protein SAMN04488006_0839 [Lutibacter maritimus]|jgi:hypothetical protein|uniref:Uncharacterized protein n=1 Tax=Lutibacter maritimus TaxID=593133 RepID=A0A1I6P337_9FLAO|nr:hypothetical protein SAMN04488006_0839 [Lutibacter maritimus]
MFYGRHLSKQKHLKLLIMKTLEQNLPQQNTKKVHLVNFSNTKRLQWDRYRRYGLYAS